MIGDGRVAGVVLGKPGTGVVTRVIHAADSANRFLSCVCSAGLPGYPSTIFGPALGTSTMQCRTPRTRCGTRLLGHAEENDKLKSSEAEISIASAQVKRSPGMREVFVGPPGLRDGRLPVRRASAVPALRPRLADHQGPSPDECIQALYVMYECSFQLQTQQYSHPGHSTNQ